MQLKVFVATLLASVVSAREFILFDDANYNGASHLEMRNNDAACCMCIHLLTSRQNVSFSQSLGNLNGKGDRASSVGGDGGCTTFYR
jgi:hypothetical protein